MARYLRLLALTLVLLLPWLAWGDSATHGLPDLKRQMQAWFGDAMPGYIVSGCAPTVPGSSLTVPAFGCEGYVRDTTTGELLYVSQGSKAIGPLNGGNGTYWLLLARDTTSAFSGWTRQPGSFYLWQLSATLPATPSGALIIAEITVAGGVITAAKPRAAAGWIDVTHAPYFVSNRGTGSAETGINLALTHLSNRGGGVAYLPCGQYRTTGQILLQSNTVLQGGGQDCAIIEADAGSTIPRPVLANSVSNVTVRDLRVDCMDATIGRQGIAGLNTTSNMQVIQTHVRRCGQYGIIFGDTSATPFSGGGGGIVWRNNYVDMTAVSSGDCVALGTIGMEYFPKGPSGFLATPGPLVSGNTVLAGAAIAGIKINNARGTRIQENYISGATCSTATGAVVVTGSEDSIVSGNHINDTRLGMTLASAPRSFATGGNDVRNTRIVVEGNTIRKWSSNGAFFGSDGIADFLIRNNMIVLDGGTGTHCIDFKPQPAAPNGAAFTRLSIVGNHCLGPATGFSLDEDSGATLGYTDLVVSGNTLSTGDAAPGYAIQAKLAPSGLYSNNTIIGYRIGIESSGTGGSAAPVMTGNVMRALNPANVSASPCMIAIGSTPTFTNNLCTIGTTGHPKYGITLNGNTLWTISGNVFVGMESGEVHSINTGTMTDTKPMLQAMYTDLDHAASAADTNENLLATVTFPAEYFSLFSGLHFVAFGDNTGAGGTKTLRTYWGGTLLGTLTISAGSVDWRIEGDVWTNKVSLSTQGAYILGYEGTTLELSDFTSPTINTAAGTVELKITCQMANGADACRSRGLVTQPFR